MDYIPTSSQLNKILTPFNKNLKLFQNNNLNLRPKKFNKPNHIGAMVNVQHQIWQEVIVMM